jgi:MFS transporter, DHA3 family, macrolide efflux protein
MPTFYTLWAGQLVSTIGSFMTVFGLTIWVWDQTQSTTSLALVSVFAQIPRLLVTTFAGAWVDRFSRKKLMLLAEVMALFCTAGVALLFWAQQLQVWHLYVAVLIYGGFGQLQTLAYSASIALIVPSAQFTRAESLSAAVNYGSAIIAPSLAGVIYPRLGMNGIFGVDLVTFFASILSLAIVTIPRPQKLSETAENFWSWENLTFGFRYIFRTPELLAMMVAFTLFALPNDINKALYSPLILARSNGNAEVLGYVTTAAGIGGVLGALALAAWGGFRRRVNGMLVGFIGQGVFKLILGLALTPTVWIGSHFLASLHIPMFYSSSNAIWYAKVPPEFQGRVLAADQLVGVTVSTIAPLIAMTLADQVFEPMARSGQLPQFLPAVVGQPGDGIALLYVITAAATILVGLGGYLVPRLRLVDSRLPDYAAPEAPPPMHPIDQSKIN